MTIAILFGTAIQELKMSRPQLPSFGMLTHDADETASQQREAISFGPFRLVISERRLETASGPVTLGGRAFDILIFLVERAGEIVNKQELLDRVWPNVTVGESSLRVHIAALRKALSDSRTEDRYIATIAGRGYCFVAPITRSLPPPSSINFLRDKRLLLVLDACQWNRRDHRIEAANGEERTGVRHQGWDRQALPNRSSKNNDSTRLAFRPNAPICRGIPRQSDSPNDLARGLANQEIDAMATRSVTKGILKSPEPREGAEERHGEETEESRPRNMPPNASPTEGFSLEVDGKIKSQYPTVEAATTVGAELKRKFPMLQVTVYDAVAKTRTLVEAAE